MGKEQYIANRKRVFEIYGIKPGDHRYNCHHICFRSDAKKGHVLEGMNIDDKANLYPILIEDHRELHKKVEAMTEKHEIEHGVKSKRRGNKHRRK